MCAELRRELVNTKKELAKSRTRLENTEQELNRTQQDLSFAQSQIVNNQVVDNRQMETSSNRENIYTTTKKIGIINILDDALDFACKLSPDVQNNISQFRDALQRRYGDNRLPEQYREDLANIKKHFKETLPEYAARGLPDQSIAYEVKIRKPQSIDDAIAWFNWHECCKGNIFKKRAEVRQIETEEQYEHTEFIVENEIRKENTFIIEENKDHKCTLNRGKTVDFNLTSSGNKRNTEVCRDIDIGKSKLSVALEDTDKLYAVDNICGDEPDRSKLSVASGQFDDAEINVSESSFLDEYVTVDPFVDITSVDVVIDRVRAVTLRVPIVIEGDYLNAVIDTGAEVTVMSQEKFLKIPENRRPQIYKAERNLVVAEAGKKMQTLGMADVSCQIGPLDCIWPVYIAPIGDELLLGCDIIDEHDITINNKRGLEIKGQWINCDVTRRSDKVARVVLKEAVTIPANSEVILPGLSINSEILDSRYCSVDPVFEDERQIIVARSLVDPYKETIPVRIVNVEKYPIRIRKNYLLGELHPVEQFEVFIDNNADVELYDSVLYKDFCIGMSQGDLIDTPVIPENWRSPKVLSTKTDSFEIEAEIPKLPDFLSELYQKKLRED
ncbi:unnamed protein product [Mytilus edulis]|uniref:Peptidase A2 domain-containing protein n=1 Tax=Mytilus edulis TaxID=6550 RepID=A0A8S3S643_MYTED|nr:unnamed protein product [Mytilus edulis]